MSVGYSGSKVTHVGVPDTNVNQLSVQQLAAGNTLLQEVTNPYFGQAPVLVIGGQVASSGKLNPLLRQESKTGDLALLAVFPVALELLLCPGPGGNRAWKADRVHSQENGLFDLLLPGTVLQGSPYVASQSRFQSGPCTDADFDQRTDSCIQWTRRFHCLGYGVMSLAETRKPLDEGPIPRGEFFDVFCHAQPPMPVIIVPALYGCGIALLKQACIRQVSNISFSSRGRKDASRLPEGGPIGQG